MKRYSTALWLLAVTLAMMLGHSIAHAAETTTPTLSEGWALVYLVVWVGTWLGVGYLAHRKGRRWYVWMLICLIVPNTIVLIILACMRKVETPTIENPMYEPPPQPSQVECDMREVARILNEKPLPAKAQWKIVAGTIVLMALGVGATVLYASTIQPHGHQPVVYSLPRINDTTTKHMTRIPQPDWKGIPQPDFRAPDVY